MGLAGVDKVDFTVGRATLADTAVIGTTALSRAGPSMGRMEEAVETLGMINVADRTILLLDSSKFEVEAFARVAPLGRIQHLVTDAEPNGRLAEALAAARVQVTVC